MASTPCWQAELTAPDQRILHAAADELPCILELPLSAKAAAAAAAAAACQQRPHWLRPPSQSLHTKAYTPDKPPACIRTFIVSMGCIVD
jgi:hypothetical protein